jgi:hypothetical protein
VVVLYHRAAPGETPDEERSAQAELWAAAEERGWEVEAEYYDDAGRGARAWPKRMNLLDNCERGDVVIVERLGRIARSLPDLVDTLGRLLDRGVHLVALELPPGWRIPIDTTNVAARVALHDAVTLLRGVRSEQLAESARSRHISPAGGTPGRPRVAVNPQEVADLYHAGLSQREMVDRLARREAPISRHKLRQVIAWLRTQRRLDDARRLQAIKGRGGLHRGGRPPKRPSRG